MTRTQLGLDDESLEFVLGSLRTLAARRLDKNVRLRLDELDEFPRELIQEMLGEELGLHLLFLPESCGGLGGGARDLFRVSEELARADLGVATAFLAIALGIDPIIVGGTDEQRERWLGLLAEEGLIVAYAVTEPAAGSNVANVETVAEPVTDQEGTVTAYRLTGTKQFITNGGVADLYTVLARTPGGPSFFVVERDTPGLTAGPHEVKHGIRASNTAQVILDGVEVPADNLLGAVEGRGLHQANEVFGFTRLMVASFGVGAGLGALERAVRYGWERSQFGEALNHKQGFTHKLLLPHAVRLAAARAYCESVADRLDSGEQGLQVEGAVAKLFGTEAGNAAADAAIQAHGGYGYIHEYEVEKIRRDVRITTLYEGTSEIMQLIIGTNRWRTTVRSKGAFYRDMAADIRERGGPGAEEVSAAAEALAETFLACHAKRLPREEIVLFELARLAAEVETAVELCRKAAGDDEELLAAYARLHAGATARDVARTGLHLLLSAGRHGDDEVAAYRDTIGFEELLATSGRELELMDCAASLLTERFA